MPGAHMNLRFGPSTYPVSVAVTGGQLLMADSANPGMVKPHDGVATHPALGVAMADALPANTAPGTPLNMAHQQPEVGVAYGPMDVDVTYSTAAALGDLLVAAANGQVAKATGTLAVGTIVGICTATAVAAGATGPARLYV